MSKSSETTKTRDPGKSWKFWNGHRRPVIELDQAEAIDHPELDIGAEKDAQADRLATQALEGIGRSLRQAAAIRSALADRAFELRTNKK